MSSCKLLWGMHIKTVHTGYDTILLLYMEMNAVHILADKNWHSNGSQGSQIKVSKHFASVTVLV
jgi:hypothetical protein